MTIEMRIKIFLTKYRELVRETGMAIGENIYDKGESSLLIRISPGIKSLYDECPSYIPLYGEDPEHNSFFAVMYGDDGKMSQLDPFDNIPEFDKPHCKTDEEVKDELKALGLM